MEAPRDAYSVSRRRAYKIFCKTQAIVSARRN